jgi:hypothetical protein
MTVSLVWAHKDHEDGVLRPLGEESTWDCQAIIGRDDVMTDSSFGSLTLHFLDSTTLIQ